MLVKIMYDFFLCNIVERLVADDGRETLEPRRKKLPECSCRPGPRQLFEGTAVTWTKKDYI